MRQLENITLPSYGFNLYIRVNVYHRDMCVCTLGLHMVNPTVTK